MYLSPSGEVGWGGGGLSGLHMIMSEGQNPSKTIRYTRIFKQLLEMHIVNKPMGPLIDLFSWAGDLAAVISSGGN